MRVFLCLALYINTVLLVSGQSHVGLPAQFVQFFKTYNLTNPAGISRDSSLEFNVGNRSLLGAFAGVRTLYAIGHLQIGRPQGYKMRNTIGLSFMNDREGTFINKSRASLLYAVHIPVSSRVALNTGVSAGFINYSYKSSDIDGGGSAFAPNLDVGIWLQTINFNLGISANQLIMSKLTPINETYFIDRYYSLNIDRRFSISYNFSIRPAVALRLLNKDTYNIDMGLLTLIQNNLLMGLAYKYRKGASISAGVENVSFGQNVFKFLCSFYSPVSNFDYYNPQSLEISLCFLHKKRSETTVSDE